MTLIRKEIKYLAQLLRVSDFTLLKHTTIYNSIAFKLENGKDVYVHRVESLLFTMGSVELSISGEDIHLNFWERNTLYRASMKMKRRMQHYVNNKKWIDSNAHLKNEMKFIFEKEFNDKANDLINKK